MWMAILFDFIQLGDRSWIHRVWVGLGLVSLRAPASLAVEAWCLGDFLVALNRVCCTDQHRVSWGRLADSGFFVFLRVSRVWASVERRALPRSMRLPRRLEGRRG